mmetsp:Transcript_53683/g.123474  ORF Transcript_53683/g.123474 Transcript_53683/m.123474 type:complete len:98 (+) Transcript_53683:1090-1383(+)
MLDGEVHKLADGLGISPVDNQLLLGFVDAIINSAPSSIDFGYTRPGRPCAAGVFHKSVKVNPRHFGTLAAARQAVVWPPARLERPKHTARFGRSVGK